MQTYQDPGRHHCHLFDKQPALQHQNLDHFMQNNYSTNPSIRVQNTAPVAPPAQYAPSAEDLQSSWLSAQRRFQQPAPVQRFGRVTGHKRNSSGSTITSAGPSSPFTPVSSSYPHVVDPEAHGYISPSDPYDAAPGYLSLSYAKDDPNAVNSSLTASFLAPGLRDYSNFHQDARSFAQYQFGMKDTMAHQQSDMAGGELLRKVSSGDFNDDTKSMESRNGVPKLDRTMSDIYQDELYNPNMAVASPVPPQSHTLSVAQEKKSSPRRDVFSERLQAANNGHMYARTGSPSDGLSRERSPFRPTSQYAHDEIPTTHSGSPVPRLGSAAQIREQQKAEADAMAFARHHHSSALTNSRTISPKEALLDIRDQGEENMAPLFTTDDAQGSLGQQDDAGPVKDLESEHAESYPDQSDASNTPADLEEGPQYQGREARRKRTTPQTTQQYPFISQPRRNNSSFQSNVDSSPEFPAHMTSMDSTQSETRSSHSQSESSEVRRPTNTTADSGTYSCTYHGCTMRFETPAKLQRHKRDGHRQGTPPLALGSDAAATRNSQAGPHKCERINPSTGKPCNSIFSRPYDLTRHEDTIHNARKQKVKCQFCTEDKTFSRNDALTRHMRVVHPEVDFPGKTKRKG